MGSLKDDMITTAKDCGSTIICMLIGAGIGSLICEAITVSIHGVKWLHNRLTNK